MAKTLAKNTLRDFVYALNQPGVTAAVRRTIMTNAKARGFDTAVLSLAARMAKMDKADFKEFDAILDLYLVCLGLRAKLH